MCVLQSKVLVKLITDLNQQRDIDGSSFDFDLERKKKKKRRERRKKKH